MICQSCGSENEPNAKFCGRCGAPMPVINATQYAAPNVMPNSMPVMGMVQPQYMRRMVTKKEFFKSQEMSKVSKNINASAIMMYIVAGITLLANVIYTGNALGLLDVFVVIGMGLGIQLAQSRACAVVAAVYSVINCIVTIIMTGVPGGWLIIVASIYAVIATFKFNEAWDNYQRTGYIQQ